ncbi:hypothetical protein [Cupriavidus numazuensis]
MTGDLVFLDDNNNVVVMENWKTALQRYLAYCEEHDIQRKDLKAFNRSGLQVLWEVRSHLMTKAGSGHHGLLPGGAAGAAR